MRVVRLPESLGRLLTPTRPTLLVQPGKPRVIVLPIDEYERLRATYDWHERMQRGA